MKAIEVAAAVIIEESRVFAAQRSPIGPLGGKWEFPGGKLEADESAGDAVVRELLEELGTVIVVRRALMTVHHQYPGFFITMHALLCERIEGDLVLTEHQQSRWLSKDELYTLDWAEADLPILVVVEELLDGQP
ncbi:MAG: (deoxy)nucleoside triphosphate pyrophosphohydrolase [Sphaerochaeta sp.]|jgi:8-oxo-dGTP diphosphatase|nr:(deoxy)nucleoside triphosphate pyrophosphohydrolase [Sphaerochaeta sp.]